MLKIFLYITVQISAALATFGPDRPKAFAFPKDPNDRTNCAGITTRDMIPFSQTNPCEGMQIGNEVCFCVPDIHGVDPQVTQRMSDIIQNTPTMAEIKQRIETMMLDYSFPNPYGSRTIDQNMIPFISKCPTCPLLNAGIP